MKNKIDSFKTRDLYIASLLYALGKNLDGTENINGVYWFSFSDFKECDEIVSNYWLKKIKVDGLTYVESIKTLKTMIFR